jgi:predicted nucleotidyltransferase
MATTVEVVDGKARYDGRTLAEWVPEVVSDLVDAFDPVRIILFGSLARGDDGPDSDLDLLLVLDDAPPKERHQLTVAARLAVDAPVPKDIIVTDPVDLARRADLPGIVRVALREGRPLYERSN